MEHRRSVTHIGLYGGTFDPVHTGHLQLARHVLARCRLDRLLFVPTLAPPHKAEPAASFADRVAMLSAALAAEPNQSIMRISRIEEHLPTPSYSINMVKALLAEEPPARYFFITGADSIVDLHHWHQPQELLRLVNGIIVARDGVSKEEIGQALRNLDASYLPDVQSGGWRRPDGLSAIFLEDISIPTSSSGIRTELARGRIPESLPPLVASYIRKHRLYAWST